MPTNTRESGLEAIIVDHLITVNGYEQGRSAWLSPFPMPFYKRLMNRENAP